ncbi:Pumilio-like protein 1 [Diplonema papillatum]|nr:Pumilio-like protein 1 [Diplonema papillatum]
MPVTSPDRNPSEVRPPTPVEGGMQAARQRSLYDNSGGNEVFIVKDGMQYKRELLLTNDWGVQPIEVLKAHVAQRWRTKPSRLSIGCGTGRYVDQPLNTEFCSSVGVPGSDGSVEVWMWPAEAKAPDAAAPLPQEDAAAADPTTDGIAGAAAAPAMGPAEAFQPQLQRVPSYPEGFEPRQKALAAMPVDVERLVQRIRAEGIMRAYASSDSDALSLAIAWADSEQLVEIARSVPAGVKDVLQAHHPQLHAALAELLNRVPEGIDLQNLLAAMRENTGPLLEVPALFSAAFSRMNEVQRAEFLKRTVSFVLPLADRPRAGLAMEACVRLQCADGAEGGVQVVKPLLDEILTHCNTLMRSGSGNFLVQQCIQLAPSAFADGIARKIKGGAESMSLHRHASHAVEQILKHVTPPVLADLLGELVRSSASAARLARSQSGNYVLQTAISRCLPACWDVVSTRIKASLPELPPVAAERIWGKLCEKAAASNLPLDMTLNFQPAPKKTSGGLLAAAGAAGPSPMQGYHPGPGAAHLQQMQQPQPWQWHGLAGVGGGMGLGMGGMNMNMGMNMGMGMGMGLGGGVDMGMAVAPGGVLDAFSASKVGRSYAPLHAARMPAAATWLPGEHRQDAPHFLFDAQTEEMEFACQPTPFA